jgi:hypothetical protein
MTYPLNLGVSVIIHAGIDALLLRVRERYPVDEMRRFGQVVIWAKYYVSRHSKGIKTKRKQ